MENEDYTDEERERIYRIADEIIAEYEHKIPRKNESVYKMLQAKGPYTARYNPIITYRNRFKRKK